MASEKEKFPPPFPENPSGPHRQRRVETRPGPVSTPEEREAEQYRREQNPNWFREQE